LGRLISLAVLATLLAQTGFYILANLGLPILFSASLPLVSFGGSALIVNMILPGVLLSTFRMDSIARDRPGKTAAAAAKC
jgi:cell division protein FtsW (lipid II flippase)